MTENKSAPRVLRVLILDDSPDDTEQASAALRQAGYMLKTQRLETGVAVDQNLDSGQWDLVLCAHGLASLPARQVVELVARKQPFLPVVVLARRVTDDELRQLMQAGARDVVLKGQWGRLAPVVERELAVVADRLALHAARAELKQLQSRYHTMIDSSVEAISYVQDGMHMDTNSAYLKLFGYQSAEQIKEIPLLNLIDKADQARFKQALRKPEGADKAQEFQAICADGNRISVEVVLSSITINDEPCVQVVVTDISKRRALEVKVNAMHQRDVLTGLCNRLHFQGVLDETLKTPGGAIIALTINQLASLNHSIGHTACDRLLVQLARNLRELTGNHATVARIGGGQFAVLLEARAAASAETLIARIHDMLADLTAGENGHSEKPDVQVTPLRLDGKARNRQQIMDQLFRIEGQPTAAPAAAAAPRPDPVPAPAAAPKPSAPAAAPAPAPAAVPAAAPAFGHDWHVVVQQALAHNQMEILFQPIVNLHGEPRPYYEAQLMLHAANGNLIPPAEYLPSAVAAGLGNKIDRATMMSVIDTLSKYNVEGQPGIVFVKLSASAVQDTALLAAIQMHLKATGLAASNLILQIDEEVLARHMEAAQTFIQKAGALGLGIALNGFTGQALSIETLANFSIDFFVVDSSSNGLDQEVLYSAIDAVLALDRTIIARGIDDADIFTVLFSRGVHYVQGDYLQPASPGLDYSFESDQTLTSDVSSGPNWRAAG